MQEVLLANMTPRTIIRIRKVEAGDRGRAIARVEVEDTKVQDVRIGKAASVIVRKRNSQKTRSCNNSNQDNASVEATAQIPSQERTGDQEKTVARESVVVGETMRGGR
jgi:hypothetical protein